MAVLKPKPVEDALRKHNGNMAAVGRKFGVTREAVRQYVAKRPALQEVCRDCRESMTDDVESSLFRAAKKGEGWAVCFYLKCQAKGRGYSEKEPDKPPEGGGVSGVPVELVTRLFALLGARQPDAGGTGSTPVVSPVASESGSAIESVSQSGG